MSVGLGSAATRLERTAKRRFATWRPSYLLYLPSIRTLIILIVTFSIVAVSAALVSLSVVTSRRIAEDLGHELVDAATNGVAGQVQNYLTSAVRVSDRFERRIRDGVLPIDDLHAWQRFLLDDLTTTPAIGSICFANHAGDAVWLVRGNNDELEFGQVQGAHPDRAQDFRIDPSGKIDPTSLRTYSFDPRQHLWYQTAASSPTPAWTPIYSWFPERGAESLPGTGYTRAIRSADQQVQGMLVVDVTLAALSDFAARLRPAKIGYLFVVDEQGLLVAASQGPIISEDGSRLSLAGSPVPAARAVAEAWTTQNKPSPTPEGLSVTVDGQHAWARITRLSADPGSNWHVIAVIPEAAFMADAQASQNQAIYLACGAVVLSLLVGVLLSRSISAPLIALAAHVRGLGHGHFDTPLKLRAAKELRELSEELNDMAARLKERMDMQESLALAREVQQSLLPDRDPVDPQLEIVGRSHYCDATGGDYYDFLELGAHGGTGTGRLFAIGDVMGHGAAAALLMASARAALRSLAPRTSELSTLMAQVNRVISEGARHRRFMTMLLMSVDPVRRSVRWASAGHDPAIVYHPASDHIDELDGGEPPLGIAVDTEYRQRQRDGLQSGDVLLLGTDGIWETTGGDGEQYGKERLCDLLRARGRDPVCEIAAALEKELADFRGPEIPHDDVTFIIVRFK